MSDKRRPTALVVYGDVLVEVLAQVEELPRPGEDAIVRDLAILPGGSAANCAVVAARLGSEVRFVGLTGRDSFGEMLRRDLEGAGVDTAALRQADGPTATTITLVERSGERAFLSFRGVAASVAYGKPPASILRPGDCLHVSGYSFQTPHSRQTARSLIAAAQAVGARVSLDPSYHFARRARDEYPDALAGLDYLFPNEEEAFLMSGSRDPAQAARRLSRMGAGTVLLKMGAAGCLVAVGKKVKRVPACQPRRVIDTTGAGDAFAGGFLSAVLRGCSLEEAAVIGHAAAALVIAELGGHAAAPTLSRLRAFAGARDDAKLLAALSRMGSQSAS